MNGWMNECSSIKTKKIAVINDNLFQKMIAYIANIRIITNIRNRKQRVL